MKAKKHYSAPTMEVVEANLECTILAGSIVSVQAEDGVWGGLRNTEIMESQVEDGAWSGLRNSKSVDSQVEDGVWNGL